MGKSRIPKPAPLINLPILSEPFERLGIDIIGPLSECRESGNRFVLSVIDLCTHYPISTPLKRHNAVNITNALLNVFCQYRFCKEILSDQGSDLSSNIIKEVLEIFKIKHFFSTIYHPQTHGCIERFGRILKSMLKALIVEFPDSWDVCLPYVLWSYRECPVEGLEFSPFELLFGQTPVGPLSLLKDTWLLQQTVLPNKKHVFQFVNDLTDKLHKTMQIAELEAKKARKKIETVVRQRC